MSDKKPAGTDPISFERDDQCVYAIHGAMLAFWMEEARRYLAWWGNNRSDAAKALASKTEEAERLTRRLAVADALNPGAVSVPALVEVAKRMEEERDHARSVATTAYTELHQREPGGWDEVAGLLPTAAHVAHKRLVTLTEERDAARGNFLGAMARRDALEIENGRLRRVVRETLRWFDEVDGGPYSWDDDEGAQAVMADLSATLSSSPESAPAPDAEARLASFVARYRAAGVTCSVMAGPDVDSDVPWRMAWRRTYPDDVVSDEREVDGTSLLDVVRQAESWEAENDAREPEHASPAPACRGCGARHPLFDCPVCRNVGCCRHRAPAPESAETAANSSSKEG